MKQNILTISTSDKNTLKKKNNNNIDIFFLADVEMVHVYVSK